MAKKVKPRTGIDNPGIVDGDVLADVLAEHAPPEWTVEASRALAETILTAMHHTGYTILRGPHSQPWTPQPTPTTPKDTTT